MKKAFLLFTGLLCAGQASFAKAVSESTAMATGANFCKQAGINSVDLTLSYKAVSTVDGASVTSYYVFNNGTNGFVIVAGDDNVTPVFGYSQESSFDINKVSPEVIYWLGKYQSQVEYVVKHNAQASTEIIENWNRLSVAPVSLTAAKTTTMLNLVHTTWNQSPLYNAMCPVNSGDTALTGCVATAMAQVMRYWEWPATGIGTHTYNASAYGALSVNYTAASYNWTAMPNSITTFNDDVSKINFDAGVSVNMQYGPTESGSYVTIAESPITNCAEYALLHYFNYASTTHGVLRHNYDDSSWTALLENEFTNSRPVIYSGYGSVGGHCWVGDAYNLHSGIAYVHFNWGWGGYANGSFLLSHINPATNDFNDDQTSIIGIHPNDGTSVEAVGNVTAVSSAVTVYPNPATETINVTLSDAHVTEVKITNMLGREMYNAPVAASQSLLTIPVGAFPAGIYLVQLHTADNTITKKIVVSK